MIPAPLDSTGLPLILSTPKPKGSGWQRWPVMNAELVRRAYSIVRWYHRGNEVQVLSSIEIVKGESPEPRAEYHVSVSGLKWFAERVYRCSEARARWVLKEFDFTDFKEDNHVPGGIVRNYWRPIAENQSAICPCNESEPVMREMKGDYIWRGAPR